MVTVDISLLTGFSIFFKAASAGMVTLRHNSLLMLCTFIFVCGCFIQLTIYIFLFYIKKQPFGVLCKKRCFQKFCKILAKFLRTPFLQNASVRLLLYILLILWNLTGLKFFFRCSLCLELPNVSLNISANFVPIGDPISSCTVTNRSLYLPVLHYLLLH